MALEHRQSGVPGELFWSGYHQPPMPEQRIRQHFIDSADLKYQAAQLLAPAIATAVQMLSECVTNGGKIVACGCGLSALQARQFAALCMTGFERERPALAALALADTAADEQMWARQIHALGQTGDVLLLLSAQGSGAQWRHAIEAAHQRDMLVIVLHGLENSPSASIHDDAAKPSEWQDVLHDGDIPLCVPHSRAARIYEMHSLILHCLCDAIDVQLLGEEEW